ncbi:phage scaffold protein [Pseudoalteromonas sp. CO325X]|uniref:phage protease n=1 Tax=Pseudoalteromonas sp. CO325X TaxID=1777262 RepID=UPI0010235175|nr:phage protease [Pseudoalteromonas sp. CO325X]RZF83715.1 phage scaffold protein [Pseudoalteromonas sp. CO325X]
MHNSTLTLSLGLAALCASSAVDLGLAACRFDAEIDEQGVSPRVMLMPDGAFKSGDGRPDDVEVGHWLLDAQAASMLKANAQLRSNDFHFDYEHQTLLAEENGKEAPASGWFSPEDLEYVPGEGLFALNVRWTPKAREYLKNEEYRYVSPVFHYDKQTGRPVKLRHFALTNDPALDGMDKVAVLKSSTNPQRGESPMNEAIKLLQLLGVQVDGDSVTDEHYQSAHTALTALKAKADKVDSLGTQLSDANQQVAALKAQKPSDGGVDLSKFVPVATYNGALEQIAVLKSEGDSLSVEQEIAKAKQDGRVIASEEEYLTDLGKQQGVAALRSVLAARSPLAALTTQQTKPQDPNQGTAALSVEDAYAADQLGISHAEFAKAKEQN